MPLRNCHHLSAATATAAAAIRGAGGSSHLISSHGQSRTLRRAAFAHRFSVNRAASNEPRLEEVSSSSTESESVSPTAIRSALGSERRSRISGTPPRAACRRNQFPSPLTPPDRAMDSEQSSHATRAVALIERHQPWEMVEDMALSIINQTYAAALEIVGPGKLKGKDGVVEIKAAVRATDPDSPVLTVHASPRRCCVALNNPRGDALPYRRYTSPKQKARPQHRLACACVSVSPGTLFLSRTDGAGPKDYRSCSDEVQPDTAAGGVLAILDMIVLRLGAAIRLEEALLVKARASGYKGPKVDEMLRVRNVLDEIRSEMDLPTLMRRVLHKRRDVTEITCWPAATAATEQDQADETERLMKKLRLKC